MIYPDYVRFPEKGYPKIVRWKVVTPTGAKLDKLQMYDVVFDQKDLKIRKLA